MDEFDAAWDSVSAAPSQDEFDLAWDSAPTQEKPGFLSKVGSAITSLPSDLFNTAKAIPSGLSNIAHAPEDMRGAILDTSGLIREKLFGQTFTPSGTDYDRIMRTARGAGKMGATTAGSIVGGTLGSVVPVVGTVAGASAGGAIGAGLWDKAMEALGADAPRTLEETTDDLIKNTVQGAILTGGASAVGKAATAMGSKLPEVANALDRKSLGTRKSDYGSANDTRLVDGGDAMPTTKLKADLDELLTQNKLGKSRDPGKVVNAIESRTAPLITKIQDIIAKADESGVQAKPNFDGALKYLESGKVPADLVPQYLTRLGELESSINALGGGKLSYLQQQKIALGKSYNPADQVASNFNRAIYDDLKTSIEKYAPEVKTLNQELSKYQKVQDIAIRSLKESENASPLSKLRDIGYTTGGIGASTLAGSVLGGPIGTAIGASVGLGGKVLASPSGQAAIARGLRSGSGAASTVGAALTEGAPAISSIFQATRAEKENKSSPMESVFSKKEPAPMSKDVKEVEAEIDQDPYLSALYEAESSRNPKAKNPKSSASGGFQFIKSTAKSLGLDDPMDLGKSLVAIRKLTDDHKERFGEDPMLLYSAHYLGAGVLKKVLEQKPLDEEEQKQVAYLEEKALPRFQRIYESKIG